MMPLLDKVQKHVYAQLLISGSFWEEGLEEGKYRGSIH